jgi:hypothetical protein
MHSSRDKGEMKLKVFTFVGPWASAEAVTAAPARSALALTIAHLP